MLPYKSIHKAFYEAKPLSDRRVESQRESRSRGGSVDGGGLSRVVVLNVGLRELGSHNSSLSGP